MLEWRTVKSLKCISLRLTVLFDSFEKSVPNKLQVSPAGLAAYKKYIDNNKRSLPGEKNKGIVKVLFNVGTDGAMWDFVIFKSVSPACDHEAIRLVREGPAWRAASMHGAEKVLAKGMAEIEF